MIEESDQSSRAVSEPNVTSLEPGVTGATEPGLALISYSSHVGINQAARLTHKGKQQIYRDVAAGKISWHVAEDGRKLLPVSDLDRLYGLKAPETAAPPSVTGDTDQVQNRVLPASDAAVTRAKDGVTSAKPTQDTSPISSAVEIARLEERLTAREDALRKAEEQIRDLQQTRDRLLDQNNRLTYMLTAPAPDADSGTGTADANKISTIAENGPESTSGTGLPISGHDEASSKQLETHPAQNAGKEIEEKRPWWKRIFK